MFKMMRRGKRLSLTEEEEHAFDALATSRVIERDIEFKKKVIEFKRYLLDSIDIQATDEILSESVKWLKQQVIIYEGEYNIALKELKGLTEDCELFSVRCEMLQHSKTLDEFKSWMSQSIFWVGLYRTSSRLMPDVLRLLSLWV